LEQHTRELHVAAQDPHLGGHHASHIGALVAKVEEAFKACISVAVSHVRLGDNDRGGAVLPLNVSSNGGRRRTSSVIHSHGNDPPTCRAKPRLPAADGAGEFQVPWVAAGAERAAAAKPADDDARSESAMLDVFPQLRHHLESVRWYNRRGSPDEARAEAAAAAAGAAAAGLPRVAAAAERIAAAKGGFLPAEVVEQLEILIDSAEALWGSSQCRL
jgi:hypothetical protein